ncbi:MAG: hypothetical protein ABIQ16_07210 [Polyangiaceae bacterium]
MSQRAIERMVNTYSILAEEVVLPSPIVIHVLRPFASEEDYLASERFSINAKTMLLIDQPPLPVDTAIVFDVSLTNGQKPIRAEGIVLGYAEASGGNPGGIRVRFKRYGAATKAFIDRAAAGAAPAAYLLPQLEPAPEPEAQTAAAHEEEPAESSGVHRKAVLPVAPPLNREALLNRLRARRAD